MATMLGFLDDVFDIRWRHKLPIPIIASIPLLIVYYSERGATDIVVPLPFRWMLGTLLHLGAYFHHIRYPPAPGFTERHSNVPWIVVCCGVFLNFVPRTSYFE